MNPENPKAADGEFALDPSAADEATVGSRPLFSKSLKLMVATAVILLVVANAMLYAAPDKLESYLPNFVAEAMGIAGQSGCSA